MNPVKKHIPDIPVNGTLPEIDEQPLKSRRVTLDTLDVRWHPKVKEAVTAARAWQARKIAGHKRASLVLVATQVYLDSARPDETRPGKGVGKTHIARAIQWSSYYEMDGVAIQPAGMFYTAETLLALLEDGNPLTGIIPPGIPNDMGGWYREPTPVVVIDDVGAEPVFKYVKHEMQGHQRQARYFQVINYCYEQEISVVITANMTLNELSHHIGGRAWSRMMEMAPKGFMLDMTGVPDYRRKAGGR